MARLTTYRVVANPFTHFDGDGEPNGVCPCDPDGHTPDRRFVGAVIDTDRTEVHEEVGPGENRSARQTTKFQISTDPVELPITPYYQRMLATGALFPADAECARIAGLTFTPPAEMLAAARDALAVRWVAETGTPAPFATPAPKTFAKAPAPSLTPKTEG